MWLVYRQVQVSRIVTTSSAFGSSIGAGKAFVPQLLLSCRFISVESKLFHNIVDDFVFARNVSQCFTTQ